MKLSVMDIECPSRLPRLVPYLDDLGYHRFWATEHHGPGQSSSPAVATAVAASLTKTMRVGAAGVMLNLYSPVRVTEEFRLLEKLFPGRIDLGVVQAIPPESIANAIRQSDEDLHDTYEDKLRELIRLVSYGSDQGDKIDGAELGPVSKTITPCWVCGTSMNSARLAGRLGAAYAFHHSMSLKFETPEPGPDIIRAYVDSFKPKPHRSEPEFNVACYGTCAETEAQAKAQWRSIGGPRANLHLAGFMGSPNECAEQLSEMSHRYGADEIVVNSYNTSFDDKLLAYGMLSDAVVQSPLDVTTANFKFERKSGCQSTI